jgi:NitT/TauT family transport system substrate-binding protein
VKAIAPNWGYVSDDGLPNVGFIMQMQDFWINAGFGFIQKPVSQQELFDLSIAKDAKERLQQEKPFG